MTPSNDQPINHTLSDSRPVEDGTVAGLLRAIQKPLTNIGRILSEEMPSKTPSSLDHKLSNTVVTALLQSSDDSIYEEDFGNTNYEQNQGSRLRFEDPAAQQVSAQALEARRNNSTTYDNIVEWGCSFDLFEKFANKVVIRTMITMFPDLDKDVIEDIVRLKKGR